MYSVDMSIMDLGIWDEASFTGSSYLHLTAALDHLTLANSLDTLAITILWSLLVMYIFPKWTWNKPDPYDFIYYQKPQSQKTARKNNQCTQNIAQRLEELGKDAVIFFGSQSGTAEGFAIRLARELLRRLGLSCITADISDFRAESIAEVPRHRIVIFILSTYGEGDPSDNAVKFWDWATRTNKLPLRSLQFAIFGLGNSNYRRYNEVARRITEALDSFEAHRLLDTEYADDSNGTTEEDFIRWKSNLISCFQKKLSLVNCDAGYEPALSVEFDDSLDIKTPYKGEPWQQISSGAGKFETPTRAIQIKSCSQLFKSGTRNCLHIQFDIGPFPELVYKTGDHLAISPLNPEEEVNGLLQVLGKGELAHMALTIKNLESDSKISLPTPTTLYALFKYYLEICAPVRREVVQALAEYAPTPEAERFIIEISRDQDTYARFRDMTHLTVTKLLTLAVETTNTAWTKLPLAFILENIPLCRVRYYSIASSSILSPRTPSITALVSNTPLPKNSRQSIPGLTTNYLLALSRKLGMSGFENPVPTSLNFDVSGPAGFLQGASVYAHVRRSNFKLPTFATTPLVMAAAGTGIAPFRAFVAERARLQSMGKEVGDMILFFGCRDPEEDLIYHQELVEIQRALNGKLRIVLAFSRAKGVPKAYVQDKIRECQDDLLRMIDADATFYICGKTTMAKDISRVISGMVKVDQRDDWVTKMMRTNKWQEDVWE